MEMSSLLFYSLGGIIVLFALCVVLAANPIYSALSLAVTMITMAFLFFMLKAYFIAGVQLIVYAGAVIILFTMVLMLFDLKKEKEAFAKGKFSGFLKISSAGWLCGLIGGAIYHSTMVLSQAQGGMAKEISTKDLSKLLYSEYLFAFEALGLLLLLVAIGAVALSRVKGGTHAQS